MQRGGIVGSVTGNSHQLSVSHQRIGDEHLLLGLNPGVNPALPGKSIDCLRAFGLSILQLHSRDHLVDAIRQPQLPGNGKCGCRMITGDHCHLDARALACLHCRFGLRPEGIDHPHQS